MNRQPSSMGQTIQIVLPISWIFGCKVKKEGNLGTSIWKQNGTWLIGANMSQ